MSVKGKPWGSKTCQRLGMMSWMEAGWVVVESKVMGRGGGQLYLCLCTEIGSTQIVGQPT